MQAPPKFQAKEVSPAKTERTRRVRVQPYSGSYFLPGKIAGKAVTFLLNSGCTPNYLSRWLFDILSTRGNAGLVPYQGELSTLADGSCIPFNGIIELTGRVCDQAIQETFIVSQPKEDAILGMPFLMRYKRHINFSKSAVVMAGRELACVDKFGRPLVVSVQVVWSCTIPRCSRATIHRRVNCRRISGLGVVEGAHERIQVAKSLNQRDMQGKILVQCVNPVTEPVELSAGSLVGRFHSVQEGDVGQHWERRQSTFTNLPRWVGDGSRVTPETSMKEPGKAARVTMNAWQKHSYSVSTRMYLAVGTMTWVWLRLLVMGFPWLRGQSRSSNQLINWGRKWRRR